MYEGKLILFYLNSKPDDWIIYKSEVKKTLELGQNRMNAAWKQLIEAGFIIKTKSFGRVDFTFNKNMINYLMNNDYAKCENATHVNATHVNARCENATHVLARILNTDISLSTDGQQNTDELESNDELQSTDVPIITNEWNETSEKRFEKL
jgi:hypothetical protein